MPHFRIAPKPSFLQSRSLSEKQPSLWDVPTENETKAALWQAAVNDDAREYKKAFEKHAQFVFSHTQHHWHHLHDGQRIPHPYCRKKKEFGINKAVSERDSAKKFASRTSRRRSSST